MSKSQQKRVAIQEENKHLTFVECVEIFHKINATLDDGGFGYFVNSDSSFWLATCSGHVLTEEDFENIPRKDGEKLIKTKIYNNLDNLRRQIEKWQEVIYDGLYDK